MNRIQATLICLGVTSTLTACMPEEGELGTDFRASAACVEAQQSRIAAEWVAELHQEIGPQAVQALSTKGTRLQFAQYVHFIADNCETCVRTQALKKAIGPVSEVEDYPVIEKHYGKRILDGAQWWQGGGYTACGESEEGGGDGPADGGDGPADGGDGPAEGGEGSADGGEEGPAEGGEEGPAEGGEAGTEGELPCESPFECLSWWGEHIGGCGDDNGGLPGGGGGEAGGEAGGDGGSGQTCFPPLDACPTL
ncbi:hypothetical protein ENSA5_52980 [Enhygromyxa salina]|uniref:Uncharacterized protein n=1 Tax=Enhygromyxa salina TaxID=215803 RepID=A0A2S9XFS1_9BACT|nr:hypothetical protein [Enhygromyxa salina]PRP91718.1 hypothetical protein ENSA5_52980 [Enhygromyxa salina]